MRFIFANSGGVAPPKQYQRALGPKVDLVLFSFYYLRIWDDGWVRRYLDTGDAMQEVKP